VVAKYVETTVAAVAVAIALQGNRVRPGLVYANRIVLTKNAATMGVAAVVEYAVLERRVRAMGNANKRGGRARPIVMESSVGPMAAPAAAVRANRRMSVRLRSSVWIQSV
jgi:hypothetical protein